MQAAAEIGVNLADDVMSRETDEAVTYLRDNGIMPPDGYSVIVQPVSPDGEGCACDTCDSMRSLKAQPGVIAHKMPSGMVILMVPTDAVNDLRDDGLLTLSAKVDASDFKRKH
jgi:hypothetical protein